MALHDLPPDIAFNRVEDEADKCSFTMSTVSSRSTILGLGSLSGKAIQAFGEALLSGIDKFYDRRRLQSIKRQLRNERKSQAPFPKAFYKALFGY
ncbi:hypothetical protein QCA50_014105 [Cerrena zonata]|uniref:Uncharacterized protein n=1 Tax=Cerrena zonata TaxID=2478898 RepID=A0AAW0FZJ9_9APHY